MDPGTTTSNITDTPEPFQLSEMGYTGLRVWNGVSNEELKTELNFPTAVKTYKQMTYHGSINAALTLYSAIVGKAEWVVKEPVRATAKEKKQAKYIREFMHGMDHTWNEFIQDSMSSMVYGFSIHEKVFRKRDDGLIAWKKLPIRSQESIQKFLYSDDGNQILGVRQNLAGLADPYNRWANRRIFVNLPREKYIHFRVGRHRGDPYGKSPLRDAYLSWRYLTVLEDIESNGVAKDLAGLPVNAIAAW